MTGTNESYILMLAKWYPYAGDPQFGVFIQKQAYAISHYRKIVVYSAHSHSDTGPEYQLETTIAGNLTEYRMYYKKSNSFAALLLNAFRYVSAWRKARRMIWEHHGKPKLLHAYILLRPAILAYFTGLVYRIPFIISEQWSGYISGKFEKKVLPYRWLSRFVFRKARARIAVSEFLRSSLINLGFQEPIEVIPNVIEIQDPPQIEHGDKIQILVVADLVDEIKNISGILKALAKARREIPNLFLSIIGQGKDEKMLQDLAFDLGLHQDIITFKGLKSNPEVYNALWSCDFLIMNSRFETFSLICAEAFSCGKPVIATRCGGPQEFVTESNGILIPVDDEKALLESLLFMARNYMQYASEKIRQSAIEKFSSQNIGRNLDSLYGELRESLD